MGAVSHIPSNVKQGLKLGENAITGAGAVVVKDVESGMPVKGVPTKT